MNKIVVGNHKMNLRPNEVEAYLKALKSLKSNQVIICPTSLYIPFFLKQGYLVGIQNTGTDIKGAYTGEVSPNQAKELGVFVTIIGHSERRQLYHETDELINSRLKAALKAKLKVILCVGETKEEHELLKTSRVLKHELLADLDGVESIGNIVIAYEPIWSIGSGLVPTNDEISKTIDYIKKVVANKYDKEIRVLYGGSVNDQNISTLNKINNLSGFLVGGASTDPVKFKKIIREVVKK